MSRFRCQHGPRTRGERSATIVEVVSGAAAAHRGIVDTFHGDHFVVTFNAASHTGTHVVKAAAAAMKMIATTEGLTVGIASGVAIVGNFGTSSLRKFCTIGSVYHHATVLQRLTKMLPGSKCLIPETSFPDVENAFYYKVLCAVLLPHGKRRVAVANVESTITQPDDAKDNEWLYAVKQQESSNPFAAENAATMARIASSAEVPILQGEEPAVPSSSVLELGSYYMHCYCE